MILVFVEFGSKTRVQNEKAHQFKFKRSVIIMKPFSCFYASQYDNVSLHAGFEICALCFSLKTSFFYCFGQVKLWCDCPFWPEDHMCRLRDCSVCECPESEFPDSFKPFQRTLSSDDLKCREGKPQAAVDRTLDSKAFRGWTETDNPWTYDDETDNCESEFVI